MNESGDVTGEDLKNTEAELIETPVVEVAAELIETPVVEVAAELIETPVVEVAAELIETPVVEVAAELIETPVVEVAAELIETPVVEVADAVYVISLNDTNCEELETIVNGHIDRLNNGRDPGKVIRSLQKIYIDIIESINNPARLTTSPRLPASGLMDVVMRSNMPENLETREVLAQKYEISLNKIHNKIHDIVI